MRPERLSRPALLLGALALCAWCAALFFAQRAGELGGGVAARWTGEGGGVSPVQVAQARRWAVEDGREDFPGVTLWREHPGQNVSAAGGGTGAAAAALEYWGDASALWPAAFLAGNYPLPGDSSACAVDEALAFALWGSSDVLGSLVRWNGKTYAVRGVFRGGEGLLLAQAGDEDASPFENMLVGVDDPAEAETLLARSGITGGALLDLPLLRFLLSALAGAPALLFCGGILLRLLRRGWRLRYAPLLLGAYLPPALAGGALCLWAAGFAALPARLIPTKWSDFSFWAKLAEDWGKTLSALFAGGLGRRELRFWTAALAAAALTLAACLLLIPALERLAVRSLSGLLAGGLGGMALVFLLAAALADKGGLVPGRALWLLPTLWLLADGALRLHQKSLMPKKERREGDVRNIPAALEAEPGEGLPG